MGNYPLSKYKLYVHNIFIWRIVFGWGVITVANISLASCFSTNQLNPFLSSSQHRLVAYHVVLEWALKGERLGHVIEECCPAVSSLPPEGSTPHPPALTLGSRRQRTWTDLCDTNLYTHLSHKWHFCYCTFDCTAEQSVEPVPSYFISSAYVCLPFHTFQCNLCKNKYQPSELHCF